MPSLRRLLPVLLAALSLPLSLRPAHAQTGVYVDFSGAKPNVAPQQWMFGPTVGVYFDHGHFVFLSTGLDLRGSFLSRGSEELNSGLIGPRLVLRPHILPFMPYVEALGGVGQAKYGSGGSSVSSTKFEYQFLGGVDTTILPRLDWRVIEFSYGGLSGLNTSYNPKTLSTGIVLRLP